MRLLLWPQFDPKTAILHLLGLGGGAAAISFYCQIHKNQNETSCYVQKDKKDFHQNYDFLGSSDNHLLYKCFPNHNVF